MMAPSVAYPSQVSAALYRSHDGGDLISLNEPERAATGCAAPARNVTGSVGARHARDLGQVQRMSRSYRVAACSDTRTVAAPGSACTPSTARSEEHTY